MDLLVNEAKVALNNGRNFGTEGEGFARINIGTDRAVLRERLRISRERLRQDPTDK